MRKKKKASCGEKWKIEIILASLLLIVGGEKGYANVCETLHSTAFIETFYSHAYVIIWCGEKMHFVNEERRHTSFHFTS